MGTRSLSSWGSPGSCFPQSLSNLEVEGGKEGLRGSHNKGQKRVLRFWVSLGGKGSTGRRVAKAPLPGQPRPGRVPPRAASDPPSRPRPSPGPFSFFLAGSLAPAGGASEALRPMAAGPRRASADGLGLPAAKSQSTRRGAAPGPQIKSAEQRAAPQSRE